MKVIFAFAFLFFNTLYAQEVVVEPETTVEISQADEALVPIPKEKLNIMYNKIKDSKFFVLMKSLTLRGSSTDFESDLVNTVGAHELQFEIDESKFRLMPLDFVIGFENEGWGSFADVLIEDDNQETELVVYSKFSNAKIGPGFKVKIDSSEVDVKSNGLPTANGKTKETEIALYAYAAFDLVNNDFLVIEQWNKVGGAYERMDNGSVKLKGLSFIVNPAVDIMFKINNKLQLGAGLEVLYQRMGGKLQLSTGGKEYEGVANIFNYEINLIKTKLMF